MFGPFALLAQENNLPLSGNVDQEILLGAVSNRIAGVPEIERQVVTEVASYGDQLSTLIEAVLALAQQAKLDADGKAALAKVEALHAGVEDTKRHAREALRQQAELALQRLRDADEEAWKRLREVE